MVANDSESNPKQNVVIITGPNDTGKSVYIKSIGLIYALAQNGFPIPALGGELSELECIITHFVHPEDITLGEGSYLESLRRVKDLFQNASPKSLLIINEPVRDTSPEDATTMNLRFVKGLITLGAPTFFTTHIHSVAKEADGWEGVRNLQTEVYVDGEKIRPTYRIKPNASGRSYGVEIANNFGLSEEDILRMVKQARIQ